MLMKYFEIPFRLHRLLLILLLIVQPAVTHSSEWMAIGPPGSTPLRFVLPPPASGYGQLSATMRSLFARTPEGDWIPISPDYGSFLTWVIDDVVVAPSDPERIYLLRTGAFDGTTIFRTLDGGVTWDQPTLPVHPNEHFVYCIAVHPEHPDTVYAGSYSALFQSEDAGDTWVEIGGSFPREPIPTDLVICPDDPSILLLGSRGDDPGIYRGLNHGETWERVFAEHSIAQLVISPVDPSIIYARSLALHGPSRIYRSTDSGVGWSLWSDDPRLADHLVAHPADPLRMYILGHDDEGSRQWLLGSVDGGQTWSVNATGEDVGGGTFVSLGIAPGDSGSPATLYLGTSFWGAFRSDTDGASWVPERFFADFIGAVSHDPFQPGRIYAGTAPAMNQNMANGRLCISEDYGGSWPYFGESDDPIAHPLGRIWAIRPSAHVAGRVWIGTTYGLFVSDDGGRVLTHRRNGLIRSVWEDPEDPDHIVTGTAWAPTFPASPPKLFETTDGGANWTEIHEFELAVMDIEIDSDDGRIYCALGSLSNAGLSLPGEGGLYHWDEGSGWSEFPDLSGNHVSEFILDPADKNRLFASTLDAGILISEDRGVSWRTMNEGLTDTAVHGLEALDLSSTPVDLVAGTWSGTFRWVDDRWESLSGGIIVFPSGGDSVALQTTALDYDPQIERLYAGTSGRSVYRLDLSPPTGGIEESRSGNGSMPRSIVLHPNYPNPFNPSTTIAFEIPGSSDPEGQPVALTVFDLRGRCVRILVESDLGPGIYRVHWDGRNDQGERVSSGIYLYTLRAGEENLTRKMTILK